MPAARARGGTQAKPRPDIYVGLLGLSLGALILAILFAYLYSDPIKAKPKPVQMSAPAGGARMPATPGPGTAPGAAAPGAVPAAGQPGGAPAPAAPPGNPPPQKK